MITLTQEQIARINAEAMPIHAVCMLADLIGDDPSFLCLHECLKLHTPDRDGLNLYAQQVFMLTQERVVNHEEALARFLVKDDQND